MLLRFSGCPYRHGWGQPTHHHPWWPVWVLIALAAIAYSVIATLAYGTARYKVRSLEDENYCLRTALSKRDYFDVVTDPTTKPKAGG